MLLLGARDGFQDVVHARDKQQLGAGRRLGEEARLAFLTHQALSANVETAKTTQLSDIDKLFDPADKLFARMNDDCIRVSRVLGT